jgi:hypothetical protein
MIKIKEVYFFVYFNFGLRDNYIVQESPLALRFRILEKVKKNHVIELKSLRLVHCQTKHIPHELGHLLLALLVSHYNHLCASKLALFTLIVWQTPKHQVFLQQAEQGWSVHLVNKDRLRPIGIRCLFH